MATHDYTYPWYAKLLHVAMAGFGITAFLTGELADNGPDSIGYLLHLYLGLSLLVFMLLRITGGILGPGPLRFADWSPFSRRQWALAWQDLVSLARLRVPDRGMHEGIAGITQMFGIVLFTWMAATGTVFFILVDSGSRSQLKAVANLHEVGEFLIPLYLVLHVGSVLLHSLAGNPAWRKMWSIKGG